MISFSFKDTFFILRSQGKSKKRKAELVFPDARLRKDDIPPLVMPFPVGHPFPLPSCPFLSGIQGKESLFWWGVNATIKAESVLPGSSLSQG